MSEEVNLLITSEDLSFGVQEETGIVQSFSSLFHKTSGMKMTGKFSGQGAKEGQSRTLLSFGLIPITIKTHKSDIPELRQEDKVCPATLADHLGSMFHGFIF
jgi:hypothetical protein